MEYPKDSIPKSINPFFKSIHLKHEFFEFGRTNIVYELRLVLHLLSDSSGP